MTDPADHASPAVGYQVIEWDLLKPPGERAKPLTHTQQLKLSAVTLQTDQELTEYSLVDRDGNTYSQQDLNAIPETPDPTRIDDVISTVAESPGKQQRTALAHLAAIAANAPEACNAAVEPLVEMIPDGPPAVQGEILGILTEIATSTPEITRPAVDPALELTDDSTHPLVRDEALSFLVVIAEHDPATVTDGVSQIATALRDDAVASEPPAHILAAVSRSHPDVLIDVVPKLELFLETEPGTAHIWALAAIGRLSKSHANIATEVIPTAARFLTADNKALRSNGAGVLADLADEYPDEVKPWVSDAIELLTDADELVRCNATSIVTRIAKDDPAMVRSATDQLMAVLDDDPVDTRLNACWALNYTDATQALPELREIAATDPDENVRSVAQLAIKELEE